MADNVSFIGGSRAYRFRGEPKPGPDEARGKRTRRVPAEMRIAVVAGQQLVRDFLFQWLQRIGANASVRAFASGSELEAAIRCDGGARLDLVVVGCPAMPVEAVCAAVPNPDLLPEGTPVVVVGDSEESDLITRLIERGVRGYVPTRLEPAVADAALRLVLAGGVYVPAPSPVARPGAPQATQDERDRAQSRLGLTVREAEILLALKEGLSNRAISEALGISASTVMVHIRNLMRKLGATNRTEAVYKAMRRLDQP